MTNRTLELEELEFAGAMKFRFVNVNDSDYTGGIPFSPADANLNRIQTVLVQPSSPVAGDTATYHEDTDEIRVFANDGTNTVELSNGTETTVVALVIGR